MKSKYEDIPQFDRQEVEAALERDDAGELHVAVLAVALSSVDQAWAEGICMRLASHPDHIVRGNAILGMGHIARIHRKLDVEGVRPLIQAALQDESEYIRGQADSAADDIELFLKKSVRAA